VKSTLFVLLLACFTFHAISQDGTYHFGARNASLAGASVALGDEYSLFNNIGGLGRVENHHIFAGYQSRYNLSEFQVIGGGGIFHHKLGNAGIGYYKFGDDLFSQQRLNIAVGNKIQMVSLGLGVDWIQYNITSIGTKQVLSIQFGGIVELSSKFIIGAHISNLNQATLVSDTGEQVPTVMKAGLSYRPTSELMLNAEVEKDLDFDEILKAGIEYHIIEKVIVRTGIRTNPLVSAFGAGFRPKNLKFDYAFTNDSKSGNTHEFSLSYVIKK